MLTIIPTVDVEGVHGAEPFSTMVLGNIPGLRQTWGVYKLADIFSRHRVPATFFVDVYETSLWGEKPISEVCKNLSDLGYDIQLHTHPGWRDDPFDFDWLRTLKREKSFISQEKDFMTKLDLDEQVELLSRGMEMLASWTGKLPVAHRSGGYSINADTVAALRKVGIPLDSSMNWGHNHSELVWSRNAVVEHDGVIELPVTLIDYVFEMPVVGEIYRKSMKTDVDTCSVEELLSYVEQARRIGPAVMNLFMHSYSLLEFDLNYRAFSPDFADEKKLNDFFTAVTQFEDVQVMDCSSFLARYRHAPWEFHGPDHIPEIQVNRKIARLGINKVWNAGYDAMRRIVRVGN